LPPLLQGTVLSTDESFARILANLDPVVASRSIFPMERWTMCLPSSSPHRCFRHALRYR
jgi:hypothetical protein